MTFALFCCTSLERFKFKIFKRIRNEVCYLNSGEKFKLQENLVLFCALSAEQNKIYKQEK